MSDLVKRLRDSTEFYHGDCELKMKAADRIEELEAKTASRTDNTQTIKIIDYIENEDGSATVKLDITQRTAQMLMEVGFLKILKDHIERTEDE